MTAFILDSIADRKILRGSCLEKYPMDQPTAEDLRAGTGSSIRGEGPPQPPIQDDTLDVLRQAGGLSQSVE